MLDLYQIISEALKKEERKQERLLKNLTASDIKVKELVQELDKLPKPQKESK